MIELTPVRGGAIATVAWIGLWTLLFDKWFFWSPLGLLIVFVLPAAVWFAWWKFGRVEGQQSKPVDIATLARDGAAGLAKLRQRLTRQK